MESLLEAFGAELDLPTLLDRVVRQACRLLRAHHGTIGLVDEVRNCVRTAAAYHMPASELGSEMRPGEGIAGEVLRTGRAVTLARYGDAPHPMQPRMLDHTVVGMPIVWRGRMIGVFGIGRAPRGRRQPTPFTRDDRTRLKTFARSAAIAITNAWQHQAEQERAERFALLNRVGRIVTADLRLDELLQRAADAVHEVLGYDNTAIPLLDPADAETLVLKAFGGDYKALITGVHTQSVHRGVMGAAVRERRPILVNDVASDPRYIAPPRSSGILSELAVPILLGDRCVGILNVESRSRLGSRDVEALRVVADQLAVAIENARLHAAAGDIAVVQERHRLARDLHDSVTQLLFSINLVAESLAPAWQRDPDEGRRRSQRLTEMSQAALTEMRSLLAELRSAEDATHRLSWEEPSQRVAAVRDLGLHTALKMLAKDMARDGLEIRLRVGGHPPADGAACDAVYRIAQEALHNVAKHARARHVYLALKTEPESLQLIVDDDGVGLRPGRGNGNGGGMGITFMTERAIVLEGSLSVKPRAGKGTRVLVSIPLRPAPVVGRLG